MMPTRTTQLPDSQARSQKRQPRQVPIVDGLLRASVLPAGLPGIQRKAPCACGGGCPRCQTKSNGFRISQPSDPAEVEADQIADRVMRMPDGPAPAAVSDTPSTQRRKRMSCEERGDEQLAQTKKDSAVTSSQGNAAPAPARVDTVLNSPGQPLAPAARVFFESRFGRDFSDVRVHADRTAAQSARDVSASAYTVGRDIVFGPGQYAPESTAGRRLIAHELTHVVQQMGFSAGGRRGEVPGVALQRSPVDGAVDIAVGTVCTAAAMNYADQFADDVLRRVEYDETTERWNINEGRDRGEWAQAMYDAWGHCYIAACMTRQVPEVVTWSLGTFYEVLHELLSQLSLGLIEHNSLSQDLYNQAVGREIGLHHPSGDLYEICFEAMLRGRLDLTLAGVVPRGRSLVPRPMTSD
jgi:hypothetical protein